jgi:CDP-glucose 4,6-dehydratase
LSLEHLFNGIFKNKTVFVTGHTGFIGSWLVLWLQSLDARVIGYSLEPPTKPSLFETLGLENEITHIIGDIQDKQNLSDNIEKHKPEIVIHLAAQPLVRVSYEDPVETFRTNILGTVNILDSIRKLDYVKACVVMTSDKCYQNLDANSFHKETDPLGGSDPYSASKGAAEIITNSFRNSFFNVKKNHDKNTGIASVRAGNVIGGGDWARDRIIPDCIRALTIGKKIMVRNPSSIRPWQFVLEPISGILWLGSKLYTKPEKYSEAWNLGPNKVSNMTVDKVVQNTIRIWNKEGSEKEKGDWVDTSKESANQPNESISLLLDSTKALTSLEWKTIYSFETAINETVSWYKSYYNNDTSMKELSVHQIEQYSKTADQMNITWAGN